MRTRCVPLPLGMDPEVIGAVATLAVSDREVQALRAIVAGLRLIAETLKARGVSADPLRQLLSETEVIAQQAAPRFEGGARP